MAAQPDGIPPEQLGIDCASPAKGPEPAPAAPELICPRTSVVCYDPAGQCKPGYCRRQFHPTAPAAPSYHEEVIKARDEGWYRDITPAAYELPREQIAYYRNEIHTGLARAWMDASAHNKQAKEIDALCDMAIALIELRKELAEEKRKHKIVLDYLGTDNLMLKERDRQLVGLRERVTALEAEDSVPASAPAAPELRREEIEHYRQGRTTALGRTGIVCDMALASIDLRKENARFRELFAEIDKEKQR